MKTDKKLTAVIAGVAVLVIIMTSFLFSLSLKKTTNAAGETVYTPSMHQLISQMRSSVFSHSAYDSYTRQAMSWRKGIAYLDVDPSSVEYLELAKYKSKLYVSFPPVPSVVEYPLTYLFKGNTPDRLLLYLYAAFSAAFLTLTFNRRHKLSVSICFGTLATAATNLLVITRFGGVWHEAQALSFALCSLAVYLITSKDKIAWYFSLFCAALAVGCRPFTVFFIPALLVVLYENIKTAELKVKKYTMITFSEHKRVFVKMLPFFALPAVVAMGLCLYNYARFGSMLEFGHNYLPEFVNAEHGQFSMEYFKENLPQCFFLPTINGSWVYTTLIGIKIPYFKFAQEVVTFNTGTASVFYLVNPIILLYMLYSLRDAIKQLRFRNIVFFGGFVVLILITCLHKTLGGYQFGARYFIDMIPYLALYLSTTKLKAGALEWSLCAFGILLNLWGITLLGI